MSDDDTPTLSTTEAASLLGLSTDQIRSLYRTGVLAGEPVGGNLRVTLGSVEREMARRAEAAKPVAVEPLPPDALVARVTGIDTRSLPPLMTVREAAQTLRQSEGAVRALVASGQLPAVMVGSSPRIPSPSLVLWLCGLAA